MFTQENFKKLFGLCAGFLLIACSGDADVSDTSMSEAANNAPAIVKTLDEASDKGTSSAKHPLWKIDGKKNTIYLVGSIHMLSADHYPLDKLYEDAYADAERLMFEIDESLLDPVAVQTSVMAVAPLSGADSLEEAVGSEDYAEIKQLAKANNIPMMMFEAFDPWFSYLNLSNMLMMNAGLSPESGIDMHFMLRAIEDGKEVDGLETLDEQLAFFESIPMEQQSDMVLEILKNTDEIPAMLNELVGKWQSGDMDGLAELLLEDMEKTPAMYDLLLKQRNINWISKIMPLLNESEDYMIVVGAGHMAGKDSVIKLLQDKGVKVTQY